MDHVVSPEDVEPVEVIDLEVDTDVMVCAVDGCIHDISESAYECDDCHADFCSGHVVACAHCNDWVCIGCAQNYDSSALFCSYCHANMTDCASCKTGINTNDDDTFYCDSHGGHVCHSCYHGNDLCNDCAEVSSEHEEEDSGSDGSMGSRTAAPWEHRGVHAPFTSYDGEESAVEFVAFDAQRLWGVDSSLSLNQGAADFYLLDVVEHNVDCGHIVEPMLVVMAEEAKTYRKNLVDVYDPTLCGYADMAIGGELRYHRAVGSKRHLPESRSQAWKYWKLLRDRGGPDVLLDAASLFEEIIGGGVGGLRWAEAARLLHQRLTNRMTPAQWVDRCFTLQHNGGAFTNKIGWGPDRSETGSDIHQTIGPAHHVHPTDFWTLCHYASPEGRALFMDWWPAANKNRMRWQYPLWRLRNPRERDEGEAMSSWIHAFINQGWSTPQIQSAKLMAWHENRDANAARFRPFYVVRRLTQNHGVHLDWNSVGTNVARRLVNTVLEPATTKVNAANMGRTFPEFLHWMCQCITKSHVSVQHDAFEFLYSRGYNIPMEYRAAVGLSLELEPF